MNADRLPYAQWVLVSLSVFAEGGVTDLRSDVELGRLDLQLGDLIDCCCFRGRKEYQVSRSARLPPLNVARSADRILALWQPARFE